MKIPLIISTRNMDLSDEMEEFIREKAYKLDHFYDGIIRCRVKVDVPHRSQRSGTQYDVRIDLTVPGDELVIKREPDQDLHVAVTNSFDVAERRLKEYAEKLRGDVKIHGERPTARVGRVFPEEGYGFLVTPEGAEIFFHENSLLNGRSLGELKEGTLVHYIEHEGEKGPQASSVTVAGASLA